MTTSDIIGTIGVTLSLIAYFLNLRHTWKSDSLLYVGFNIVGSGLACLSAWLIFFVPIIVLEGTWTILSIVQFYRISMGWHKKAEEA